MQSFTSEFLKNKLFILPLPCFLSCQISCEERMSQLRLCSNFFLFMIPHAQCTEKNWTHSKRGGTSSFCDWPFFELLTRLASFFSQKSSLETFEIQTCNGDIWLILKFTPFTETQISRTFFVLGSEDDGGKEFKQCPVAADCGQNHPLSGQGKDM